jgi:P4 family phage/plasmid primase-like protien
MTTLDRLADDARWIAWRAEKRGERLTKVPYAARGGKAKADDPRTWAPRAAAEQLAARIVNGSGGGVGIMLGDLGIILGNLGDTMHLAGIDLDSCLDAEGSIAPWAGDILAVAASYAEISPSGHGIKVFFFVAAGEVRPFLDQIGVNPEAWGARRGVPGEDGRDHGPAIEIYFAGRYFTVTDRQWPNAPDALALIDGNTLDQLAQLMPPLRRTEGARSGRDNSRSAIAWRKGAELIRAGKSYDEMVAALRTDPETADWCREKGDLYCERELRRIWERARPNAASDLDDEFDEAIKRMSAPDKDDGRPPTYSDENLALRFALQRAADARHVAMWGRWLFWTGSRWQFDETLRALDHARKVCRAAAAEITDPRAVKLARAVASAKAVAAVVGLARADRRHAATVEQFDADPWLLNTPGGIVDLRIGAILPHDPTRYMTKITAVAPGGECPLCRKFLNEITRGDAELQAFLRRVAGYALTGIIREHAVFFAYGTGGNGKGVFLNTLSLVFGDYAVVAPMTTFLASHTEQHPTDLAGLRGARLVTAQETEEGRRWAESKIKALTGGDPIAARFMRQDFFTFQPQFKLVIAGNHKPGLRGVDEAIRRRFHLIPFTVTFTKPDKELPEKLRSEWSGILQWAIEGCLEWQRVGLAPPAAVRAATDEYLASEDALTQWLGECCCLRGDYTARSSDLFASWKAWAESAGEFVGNQKRFSRALEDRGFVRGREPSGRVLFRGIALRQGGLGGTP